MVDELGDNIKPRFRLDKVKSHLRNSITLLFVPSRGGVARLQASCLCLLLAAHLFHLQLAAFVTNSMPTISSWRRKQKKEEIIQISNQEKRALEEENRQVKELAKQAEEIQNRLNRWQL